MIIHIGILFLVLSCVRTYTYSEYNTDTDKEDYEQSIYRAKLTQLRNRREDSPTNLKANLAEKPVITNNITATKPQISKNNLEKPASVSAVEVPSEGGIINPPLSQPNVQNASSTKTDLDVSKLVPANGTNAKSNEPQLTTPKVVTKEGAPSNLTNTETLLQEPGVVKRGLIVFGGFTLLAVAYFVFYRRKGKKYDANSSHSNNDTNQFRYGVLQSDDRRDNLELSRIPLTMESDEDDEEDLEIFDLEQKKKSLSYVNLQTNDEDLVLRSSRDESKNNLLLDIEDGPSDPLINWSSSGSKSIL